MNPTTVSKNLTWFYNIKMNHENDIIKLVGFTKNGSITSNKIKYNDYLKISFDVLIYQDAVDMSAILDIDFDDEFQRYFSAIIKDGQIRLLVKELNDVNLIAILDYTEDWTRVTVDISSSHLVINVGEHEISHVFQDTLSSCYVSFGNNYPHKVDHIYAFEVKNIEVSTENGVFPLIIKDVIENKYMIGNI